MSERTKSQRLMELLLTVNRRKKFTVKELATQFGVSSRTILRDLQELSELGVPLYSEVGPHGGYQVLSERVLPPIAFTEGEAVAIFFASHALRHYSALPFEAETDSLLTKFYAYLPTDVKDRIDEMKNRVNFRIPPRDHKPAHLRLLLDAAITGQTLRIEYESRSGSSIRDIRPLGIYAERGFWYCPAYCFLRDDIRLFRVDYMRRAEPAEHAAPVPDDISDLHLHNWDARYEDTTEYIAIHATLTRTGVRRCEAELWRRPEITVHPDGSGEINGKIPAGELSFFADFFIGLGQDAVVKSPEPLVQLIKERLNATLAHYAE